MNVVDSRDGGRAGLKRAQLNNKTGQEMTTHANGWEDKR